MITILLPFDYVEKERSRWLLENLFAAIRCVLVIANVLLHKTLRAAQRGGSG